MPRSSNQGALDSLIADLGRVPPEMARHLRPALRKVAEPVRRDAMQRASWSTRIPRAIRVQTSFSQRAGGIRLKVDQKTAPHGRPLEHGSRRNRGVNRHPVFGRRSDWVAQPVRPFFWPAVLAGRSVLIEQVGAAVDATARSVGFTRR